MIDYGARARALVGRTFRPQGRSEAGLDCVGVVLAAFDLPDDCVRRTYALRGRHEAEARAALERHFRRVGTRRLTSGDVMLMRIAEDQIHLGVRTERGFVHAHAGIRRVVETPGLPAWPLAGVYRKRGG